MKTALLVDDDEIFCLLLLEALAERLKNCALVVAGNGREAEQITASSRIDFVITDLNMPVMDGYEFIARTRVNHPDLPILVMTGKKTPEVEQRLQALGIPRCLEKPFDIRTMVPRILEELAGITGDDSMPSFNSGCHWL
jgi:CheY-like chemotaxis protein